MDGRAGTRNRREGRIGSEGTAGKGRPADSAKQSHPHDESVASFLRNKATAVRRFVTQRASAGLTAATPRLLPSLSGPGREGRRGPSETPRRQPFISKGARS